MAGASENASCRGWRFAAGGLLVVLVLLVAAHLFPTNTVLGAPHTDMVGQFIPWRGFAADSIRHGDFPLWNPYTYAGQPFLGGFQSALFYPPNAAFVFLPLDRALNFSVLLHLAVLAGGMAFWVWCRGLHLAAALVAGWALALSGVVFPHVYAGHLSNLCTMAWAPWAFAGLEAWWRARKPGGLLLASAAVALQIFAGQVQYVFFFGVAAGVHALVATVADAAVRKRALPAVAVACAAGALLSAAQLLPGLEAASESVRHGRVDYRFASAFALPPENLLTAIAPGFFGHTDRGTHPYWGRCYPWEMSVYFGVSGLIFVLAALGDRERRRQVSLDLIVASALVVLALGRHLPLYGLLYTYVPGFDQFRGMSKFTFPAMLFVLLAVAAGIDGWLRTRGNGKRVAAIALSCALALGVGALALSVQPAWVSAFFEMIRANAHGDIIAPPTFPPDGAAQAASSVGRAAAICFLADGALWLGAARPRWKWALVALLPIEMIDFARHHLATTPISAALPGEMRELAAKNPGDYRVLNLARPNAGYLLGSPDIWGNDPGVLKRYAEFMTFSQGGDPDTATQNLAFASVPRLYAMLRCRTAFVPTAAGLQAIEIPDPMPRALLVARHRVLTSRDEIFAALSEPGFDPRETVILEREPAPQPQPAPHRGKVQLLAATNDSLTIEADVAAPALLLLTELYSRGWRASPAGDSAQESYDVVPANYFLRAVPLAAGKHRLRLEYRPASLTTGLAISAIAWSMWLGAALIAAKKRR